MAKIPVDILDGPKYALRGRIVTMNSSRRVFHDGIIYIDKGRIADVKNKKEMAPEGFKDVPVVNTKGTIYPGLIELHNHLSYNILRLWQVPKKYTNRNQWGGTPEYRKIISGPMNVLGRTPGYIEAIVRYVECKCLMGGVTTSQGIALFSNNGIQKYYRGIVRNVEDTDDADLPEALAKISDVEAKSVESFYERLKKQDCMLLHLSEGTDTEAHKHFTDLQLSTGEWAVTNALAGIHCVALEADDFKLMKDKKASMVWSPLSNLLLYGQTADIASAIKNKLLIGLGSDWSPSGSKNLFGELKVARLVANKLGIYKRKSDILALATINAAKILKWDKQLGSIEKGKMADLLVVSGTSGNAYEHFLNGSEKAISLVVINGVPHYGHENLMNKWDCEKEKVLIGETTYNLNLKQETADPVVGELRLEDAIEKLNSGLADLPHLAELMERPQAMLSPLKAGAHPQWFLVLDHNDEVEGEKLRMTISGSPKQAQPLMASQPLSEIVEAMELDKMTVADDPDFMNIIQAEQNLPQYLKDGLVKMYQ
ncbi:MAG: amidohydrolase family protein [Prolixibacteraceae bacterium]|jgi:cytosine/adenosine deaminase-related metal-dependent hydrolase